MSLANVENTRPIVDEEELADKDADLEGGEEGILHVEVESTVIHMVTVHTLPARVRNLGRNTKRKQPFRI